MNLSLTVPTSVWIANFVGFNCVVMANAWCKWCSLLGKVGIYTALVRGSNQELEPGYNVGIDEFIVFVGCFKEK
jgi:hypothetical protein